MGGTVTPRWGLARVPIATRVPELQIWRGRAFSTAHVVPAGYPAGTTCAVENALPRQICSSGTLVAIGTLANPQRGVTVPPILRPYLENEPRPASLLAAPRA